MDSAVLKKDLPDTVWIFTARGLRDFGDGFAAILLPAYLAALGFDATAIGLIATASLLGSASVTLCTGMVAERFGNRQLLMAASMLMLATGIALACVSDYALLLVVAFFGTANPSAGSVSAFVPLEHAALSGSTTDTRRTHTFALYGLIGALAAAGGSLAAASPDFLHRLGIGQIAALKLMFVLYGLLGVAGGLLYARLPRLQRGGEAPAAPLGPSRGIVYRLAALFSVDSFAGGFVVQSLLALWLFDRFGLSLTQAAVFFFWSGVLGAFSFPVAAWLGKRIGLVKTMVFTHLPSNLLLIAAAVAPTVEIALACLLVRAALSQMDVPTRSSYVMAVVTPPERAAAASVTAVPRSLAAAISPALAGALYAAGLQAWPLIICGVLKTLYDLTLLYAFSHMKPPEERAGRSA
jgi:MFS family permease